MSSAPRLVYVVTHPVSADNFLRGQLTFMRERGFDVTLITSPGPELDRVVSRERISAIEVPMERPIRPRQDAASLVQLTREIRRLRPEIVNASTPKAGLLGMLAARATGVRNRIYLLQGLRLETEKGALRRVLSMTEQLASSAAHEVVCASQSLLETAAAGGHIPRAKAKIVGPGSSNGVDVERWRRTPSLIAEGSRLARDLGIDDADEVIGFVGRFHADKGLPDLLDAFATVRRARPRARLLLIGAGYLGDDDPEFRRRTDVEGVVSMGPTSDLAPFYARMTVLAFPSYREGFPNVPLEAACAEVPTVGYRSTGVVDAVEHGVTGVLVAQRDTRGLADALLRYLTEPDFRAAHGLAARERAARSFSNAALWEAWALHYERMLERSRP